MRLTKEDAKIIRNKARQLAGALRIRLEVGIFTGNACPEGTINQEVFGIEAYHTTDKISDLDDYMDWSSFRKEDLKDITVDIYISTVGNDGELKDNLICQFRSGRLVKMWDTAWKSDDKAIWIRK